MVPALSFLSSLETEGTLSPSDGGTRVAPHLPLAPIHVVPMIRDCEIFLDIKIDTPLLIIQMQGYRYRPMGRRTIGPASYGLGRVWPAGISLSHCALATPVVGGAQCTLTSSPGVRCFLRHIGAPGFRVGWALCQEAVRLGWVVFRTTHGFRPSRLPSPNRSRLHLNQPFISSSRTSRRAVQML
jgi:hypothetical protein